MRPRRGFLKGFVSLRTRLTNLVGMSSIVNSSYFSSTRRHCLPPRNPDLWLEDEPMLLTDEMKATIRIPYALRHVPGAALVHLLRIPTLPTISALARAVVKHIVRNTAL